MRVKLFLCLFFFSQSAFAYDLSVGGGAVFGETSLGTIQGNLRVPFKESFRKLDFFWGGDVKIVFPKGSDLGFSLGAPLTVEWSPWRIRPYASVIPAYAYVVKHRVVMEGIVGASFTRKELEGMRVYAGWAYYGAHSVTVGGLIFLAW